MNADLLQLIDRYLDGDASAQEIQTLTAWLESDDTAIQTLAARAALHTDLRHIESRTPERTTSAGRPHDSAAPQPLPLYRKGHEPKPAVTAANIRMITALAAALLIACGIGVYVAISSLPQSERPDPAPDHPVATLIDATAPVIINRDRGNPGNEYAAGDYAIESGAAQLMLTNNVGVRLRGDTRMTLRSAMHATVTRGSATFRCPDGVTGFTVDLPGRTRVRDLGTEFAVRVDDAGACTIYVIDGLVELAAGDGSVQQLAEGEAYSVDTVGAVAALTRGAIVESFGSIVFAAGDYERMILDDEPVAYWPMSSGDAVAIDLATDTTADATGVRFDADGPNGASAAAFDGEAFVDLGERPDLLIDGPMTVEAWVWIDPNIKQHGRVISFDGTQGAGWALGYTPVGDQQHMPGVVFTMLAVADYPFADVRIAHGRWTHLAATLDASRKLTIYIDGRPVGTAEGVAPFNTPLNPRAFLGQQSAGIVPLVGRLAHVAVYDRALRPTQIRSRQGSTQPENESRPYPKEQSK